jgi:prepilin-type N-terminal cleavage/methylation domain-containing protein
MKQQKSKQAFSLVELSIVIIIMGLLVASVTVGRDLIQAASLRATISQLGNYDAAVNTFELKYNGFPGDLDNASRRGLTTSKTSCAAGYVATCHNGDGDGYLEDANSFATNVSGDAELITGEGGWFWEHIYKAGFADAAYSGDQDLAVIGTEFPKAKSGGGISVYGSGNINYYHIGAANSVGTGARFQNIFEPEDAFSIDNKLDDGLPFSGFVIATSSDCASNPDQFSCVDGLITTADNGFETSSVATTHTKCVIDIDGGAVYSAEDEYDFETTAKICQLRVKIK